MTSRPCHAQANIDFRDILGRQVQPGVPCIRPKSAGKMNYMNNELGFVVPYPVLAILNINRNPLTFCFEGQACTLLFTDEDLANRQVAVRGLKDVKLFTIKQPFDLIQYLQGELIIGHRLVIFDLPERNEPSPQFMFPIEKVIEAEKPSL